MHVTYKHLRVVVPEVMLEWPACQGFKLG
jgi:hypothetical protein